MAIYLIVAGSTPSASGLFESGSGLSVDFATVARQGFVTSVGDGTNATYTITHNLATRDVSVQLYDNSSPFDSFVPDILRTTTNTITLTFAVAPSTNRYRVVITPVRT